VKPPPSQPEPVSPRGASAEDAQDRYQGFSLRSVTWGYREIFQSAIEELFRQGYLGPQRQEVTGRFFALMKQADQSCFDHVLRHFLGALNPANRWIMDVPAIFADVTQTGAALAHTRLYCGTRFFETLAQGGMGTTPQEVRDCLGWLRRLREIDEDLAMAFLAGHGRLSRRLRRLEMERYIDVAIDMHRRSRPSACAFLRGELKTSETYILAMTQECRLCDVDDALAAMIKALTGEDCEIADLSQLDSDDLIERGTRVLALHGHLYLPERFRGFDRADLNRKWYLLCGIACASMLLENSFARVHGHPEYRTCADLAGHEVAPHGAERALADAMDDSLQTPAAMTLRRVAEGCVNCFDVAARLDEPWARDIVAAYPAIATRPVRPAGFLSDFLFPVSFSGAPHDQLIADLKDAAGKHRSGKDAHDREATIEDSGEGDGDVDEEPRETARREAAFIYDEWDFQQNDYRPSWCHVHAKHVEPSTSRPPQAEWLDQARKVRAVFERLKPDMARREKRLSDGDDINADRLLEYLLDRHREPSPPVRFYERPLVNHRDLAVLILLDLSGSTGEQLAHEVRVLDVEKQAAIVLGQGLAALGDRFAVCGFSSNGREKCEYLTFKSFDDRWSGDAVGRVMAAWPRSSTRIGPALRHSGYLLSLQPARQRLIIVVTDGKPTDQGYDPNTRYAQHDVRMACEENARNDVHTFGISTEENSLADMEIMFPRRRFVILPSIAQLPRLLPQFYLRLTL